MFNKLRLEGNRLILNGTALHGVKSFEIEHGKDAPLSTLTVSIIVEMATKEDGFRMVNKNGVEYWAYANKEEIDEAD